jgi:cell division cycle 20-like protein 1, cofactor of APC complex
MTDRGTESDALPSTSDILNNMSNRLVSPPGSRTPPSGPTKNTLPFPDTSGNHSHLSNLSEAVDPAALASALRDYDEAGRRRERTPGASPSRKRQRVYGDR